MIDRTPTEVLANGAVRYGIYDAAGLLLRYEYIKPEDAPTQEGTPLNKATLLKDATAALYGKDATAVPDDILAKIALVGLKKQVYATAGTYTFTPSVTGWHVVEVVGAGGRFSNSAGGAAGGYALKSVYLSKGVGVTVTVGAGMSVDGTGGSSSFGAYVSATGGGDPSVPGGGVGGDINIKGGTGVGNGNVLSSSGATKAYGPGCGAPTGVTSNDGAVIITFAGYGA